MTKIEPRCMGVIKRKFRGKTQYFAKIIIYLLKLGVQIFRIITVLMVPNARHSYAIYYFTHEAVTSKILTTATQSRPRIQLSIQNQTW